MAQIGHKGEILFEYFAADQDWEVSKPFGNSDKYDYVVNDKEKLFTVQVKTCKSKKAGSPTDVYEVISCKYKRGKKENYEKGDFDYFAFVILEEKVLYLIPAKLAIKRSSVMLYPHRPEKDKKWGKYLKKIF